MTSRTRSGASQFTSIDSVERGGEEGEGRLRDGEEEDEASTARRVGEGEITLMGHFTMKRGCEMVDRVKGRGDVTRGSVGKLDEVAIIVFCCVVAARGGCSKVTFLRSADSSGKTIRDAQPDWRFASNQHHTVQEPPSWR